MSQPKHTPGEWKYILFGKAHLIQKSKTETIAVASANRDEVAANARLIAAAPEMLEALELGRKYLESRRTAADAADPDRFVFAEALRVAIAKATGGAE